MSAKQFVSAGDAETLLTEVQERLALRPKTFTGTTAAWEGLPIADREKYEIVNITDDAASGEDSGQKIQVIELPTADATSLGKIYQYIGATTDTLVNGFFYQCIFDNGVYQWIGKAVQAGGGGGQDYIAGFGIDINSSNIIKTTDFVGTEAEWDALSASEKAKYDFIYTDDEEDVDVATPGHAIVDSEGVEKVQRTNLQFEDLMVGDDSTNDTTTVSAANKQNVVLSSALPIGGVNRTTVEDALGALADETSGHTILNESDTPLPQRDNLKFNGAIVSDDSANDTTVVETVNPVDYEEDIYGVNLLDPKWFQNHAGCTVNPIYNNGKLVKYTLSGTTTAGHGLIFARRVNYDLTLPVGETFVFSISATLPFGVLQVGYTHPTTGAWTLFKWQSTDKLEFTVPAEAEGMCWTIQYVPGNNQTFNNLDIHPMFRKATIQDDTYRPYNQQSIQHQLTDQTNVLGGEESDTVSV